MDTRPKILQWSQARSLADTNGPVLFVAAYFDPLTAEHAGRLASLAQAGVSLIVIVAEPPDPILPARARAELVAGLASVRHVVIGCDEVQDLPANLWIDDRQADLLRRAELSRHVHARHRETA